MKTRKLVFNDYELSDIASKFKILSESSRLKILRALSAGEKCVKEITLSTGLMQANVSKQLKILESNNIVACRPSGLQRYYTLSDSTVLRLCNILCQQNNQEVNEIQFQTHNREQNN